MNRAGVIRILYAEALFLFHIKRTVYFSKLLLVTIDKA